MKAFTKIVVLLLTAGFLAACYPANSQYEFNRRKIYLTQEDYLEDMGEEAALERREAQPLVESEYIFNVVPETDKSVYFFDARQQPKVPGQPGVSEYKNEKRLWTKPKRYSPEEYYGMQGDSSSSSSSEEISFDY